MIVVADAATTDLKKPLSLARRYHDSIATTHNLRHMDVIPGTMMSAPNMSERSDNNV